MSITPTKESLIMQLERCASIAKIRVDKTKASADSMRVTAFFVPNDLADEMETLILEAKEQLLKTELARLEPLQKRFADAALAFKAPQGVQEGLKW